MFELKSHVVAAMVPFPSHGASHHAGLCCAEQLLGTATSQRLADPKQLPPTEQACVVILICFDC
jgi:hypothetical protein